MNLTFISNWKNVLTKAWSIRLIVIAAMLSGIEVALPMLGNVLPIPEGTFAALSGLASAAAFFARILAQDPVAVKEEVTTKVEPVATPMPIDMPDEHA